MELKDRIAERILDLEAKRDAIDATITALREILAEADAEEEREEAAGPVGNGRAAAADNPPRPHRNGNGRHHANGTGKPRGSGAGDGKLRIARLLLDGPKRSGELAEGTGLEQGTVAYHLKGDWFRRTDPSNRLSPWELTEAGREAAESFRG